MELDFSKPNAKTLGWIEYYFQNDDKLSKRWERNGAPIHYSSRYDGWDDTEKKDPTLFKKAWFAALSFMADYEITEEDISARIGEF